MGGVDLIRALDAEERALKWGDFECEQNWPADALDMEIGLTAVPLGGGILPLLHEFAEKMRVREALLAQFTADILNESEGKMACHPLLRAEHAGDCGAHLFDEGEMVLEERRRMHELAEAFRSGELPCGTNAKPELIVHLGTGGSHWPVRLLYEALGTGEEQIACRFVASNDPAALESALRGANPETTAVVVSSKSFRTEETLGNAQAAFRWLKGGLSDRAAAHMFAATAHLDRAIDFGVPKEQVLRIPEWAGGRYSAWSAASFSAVAARGSEPFELLLQGGRDVDDHIREEPPESNLPLLLALARTWAHDFVGCKTRCMLVYAHRLRSLVEYCQQQFMESCGKTPLGNKGARWRGCEVVWGGEGPAAEHSILQFLLQGGIRVQVEMVAFARDGGGAHAGRRTDLLAHCLGQREALHYGSSIGQAVENLIAGGMLPEEAKRVSRHLAAAGQQPTVTLLLDEYAPRAVGRLLALQEHATVAQAAFRGVNPYDQWAVELGKMLTKKMRSALDQQHGATGADALPNDGLVGRIRKLLG